MDFALVVVVAALAAGLTLYSGFGLGTLLLPVFTLFFPVEVAVAATALVHGASGALKAGLFARQADLGVIVRFGLPAIAAALVGVWVLGQLSGLPALLSYPLGGRDAVVTPVKLAMALLMAAFAVVELHPRFERLAIHERYLPIGGVLSGFFGGLSGHQGSLRSAFLAKVCKDPAVFVGTSAVISLLVDVVRLGAYAALLFGGRIFVLGASREGALVVAGALAAFAGVLGGRLWLRKITMRTVQAITGGMLILVATLLALGII